MATAKFREQASVLLTGYGLQFLAGMLLNLFVKIPACHPGSSGTEYFSRSWHSLVWALSDRGGWELAFHVYLALVLVLGSISLCLRAIATHSDDWAIAGGVAAIFTLGAFFNGLSFIDYNKNVSSMIMASCWLVAVAALIYGIVKFPAKSGQKPVRASK